MQQARSLGWVVGARLRDNSRAVLVHGRASERRAVQATNRVGAVHAVLCMLCLAREAA